ncbi:hypothetical protein [Nannocystis radixulma]|uniref:Uncharacterized protein n=1 Tax=Nannocystis radixulma TaxID=2995305 RepID=A0ABT5B4I6_9BACT|nr:hypothetical protein [Nannocystis radixulma]MDC0668590.1 hypothetical protein [Nannocystis radixulma]
MKKLAGPAAPSSATAQSGAVEGRMIIHADQATSHAMSHGAVSLRMSG